MIKVYKAILNQSGTDHPIATELVNDIGVFNWSRDDVGFYSAWFQGPAVFPEGKTWYMVQSADQNDSIPNNGICFIGRLGPNEVDILRELPNGTRIDGLINICVVIEVYP